MTTPVILSNVRLSLAVRDSARENALQSFEYFANTVLASTLSEDLCSYVQDAVEDMEDVVVSTNRPRTVAVAIYAWLTSRGVQVETQAQLPRHEVLHWLELGWQDGHSATQRVVIDLIPQGVRLAWHAVEVDALTESQKMRVA